MIPIKDDNPRMRMPIFTVGLIVLNVIIFFYEIRLDYEPIMVYGAIPSQIANGQNLHTLITSMFLHGGFMHLAGNMLYLWIFGDNIESYLGHGGFLVFYLLCGLLAAAAHIFSDVFSGGGFSNVPMVGASGAISGVLGAYLVKYPKARVLVVIPFWILIIRKIPAFFVLGFWFVIQLFSGLSSIGMKGGGIAFWAHIGGFVAGILLIHLFPAKKPRRSQAIS